MSGSDCDVAVVGGGAAGLGAALAAAQAGARTLLVEEGPALGGNATAAFVHTLCGVYRTDTDAPEPANPGLALRFAEGLVAAGGASPPERVGRVWVVPTEPPAIEGHALGLCREAGVDLRMGCALTAIRLGPGDAPHRLVLEGATGRSEVLAQLVVDASGDGALAGLGAVEAERAGAQERQLPSYIVRLAGVPAEDVAGYGRLRLAVAVAGAVRQQALPEGCESVLLRPAAKPGEAYLTFNVSRADATAAPDRAALEQTARAHVEAVVAFLRATRPGYAECRVESWPRRLGVREGARLAGLARVDHADLLAGRRRDDEVAVSTWPIELWHDHRRALFRYPEAASSIPLGALVSRSHGRVGMAGRCLSASHEALGALRVLGTALATGEAIGLAAALAASSGRSLADVTAAEVRRARRS
ncbi:MAG: FAD-dependent oxidoreductase [Myxococcota bacterium]